MAAKRRNGKKCELDPIRVASWLRAISWKTAARKPVKNVDLWQRLDQASSAHDIEWAWVKGHSGHRENDIADQLANRGIDEL